MPERSAKFKGQGEVRAFGIERAAHEKELPLCVDDSPNRVFDGADARHFFALVGA